ncbi:MAG: HNH endonuclease [Saprospiraceae bacterium]|nr:HNH endonuclease [Saprospiraceae bacterium]
MINQKECAYCESEITKSNDSKEHIIPNSIGGRKTVCGFICQTCNNSLGRSWDAALAKQLEWFSLTIGIKRDRAINSKKNMIVQTQDGTELRLQSTGIITSKDPFCELTESDGQVNIRMFARTKSEAEDMLKGIKKKYPEFNVEKQLKSLKLMPFKVNSGLQPRLELGGVNTECSIVKTAIAMCVDAGIESYRCEIGIHTLKTLASGKGFCPFYTHDMVIDRPKSNLFHLVTIRGDPEKSTLIAYIEYFGAMRRMVKLSNKFKGNSFKSVYAINPHSGEELDLSVNWDIPEDELEAAFNDSEWSYKPFANACENAVKIASDVRKMREIHHGFSDKLSNVRSHLGLEKDSMPELKDRDEFNRFMTKQLGSYPDYINDIPQMPTRKK